MAFRGFSETPPGPARDAGSGRNHVGGVVESISDRGALVRYEVATVRERWCLAQIPVRRRGSIFPLSDT